MMLGDLRIDELTVDRFEPVEGALLASPTSVRRWLSAVR
jgi:hypothetical protein